MSTSALTPEARTSALDALAASAEDGQELDVLVHPKRLLELARCGAAGAPPLGCAA